MSIIYNKVARDIWRNKARTLMVVLSTGVGILALGMVMTMSSLMTSRLTGEWEASRPAHVTLYTSSVDQGTVDVLARTRGVADIEPAISTAIQWKHPGETEWRNAGLDARRDYQHQRQDIVTLVQGAWPRAERNALLVERQSSMSFNVPAGSTILVKAGQVEREMRVIGVARSLTVFPPQFGGDASFYATPEILRDLLDLDGFNQLKIRLPAFDRTEAQAVGDQLKKQLEKGGTQVSTPQIQDPKRHFIQNNLDPIFLVMGVIGALALVISAFLIVNTINAVLAQQVTQIGVMKTVGATTDRVVRVYLTLVLIYGLCAIALAVPLAAIAGNALSKGLLALLNIEASGLQFVPQVVLVQVAVGLIVPVLAAVWPVLAGTRISVRQAIASYGLGADYGKSWLDKLIAGLRGLPRPLALSLRNTFRRKGRVMLTLITLMSAGAMFMMVMSLGNTFTYTIDKVFEAYNFDVEIYFTNSERFERVEAIAAGVPGVTGSEVRVTLRGTWSLATGTSARSSFGERRRIQPCSIRRSRPGDGCDPATRTCWC